MNAIILSREDADFCQSRLYDIPVSLFVKANHLLENGTPGYSWLSVVPDEVLSVLDKSVLEYDGGLYTAIIEEQERRYNLKSTKD